jgi:cytochrome P450
MIPKISFTEMQRPYRQLGPAYLQQMQQKYGDLFYVTAPLMPRIYLILHPQMVYDLLLKQTPMLEKSSLMRRILSSSFGNGLFTSEGDFWRRQRKLMQPMFHHARLGRFAERMVQHTLATLEGWQDGAVLVIDEAMHTLTFTIVVDALFSADVAGKTATSTGDQRSPLSASVVHQAMHDLAEGLAAQSKSLPLTLLPEWIPLPALRQKRRGTRQLAQLVTQMIAERRNLGEAASPPDLLSTLLFSRDAETGESMGDEQVADELVTLYIAGHETTAVLLDWAWVLLAQNPMAETRLHEELEVALNGRPPTLADLPQLPFTNAIIKEALRLYPPAWFLFREAPAGFELAGEPIPKGSILFLYPYAVQRDGRWYDEPDAFKPERWLDDLEKKLPKGAYLPFGMGPRICIGNGFAQMEAQLLLATIAQRFRLEQLDEARMGPAATLSFAQPVRMQLYGR